MPPLSSYIIYSARNPLLHGSQSTSHSRKRKKCDYFKPFCTSHFASGIDHLLDNISYSTAVAIRRELYTLMGRSMYYRIRNKERLLHPCEQEQIAAIFLKHGIKTKPEFDRYIDKYDW